VSVPKQISATVQQMSYLCQEVHPKAAGEAVLFFIPVCQGCCITIELSSIPKMDVKTAELLLCTSVDDSNLTPES
jgi:hypothetical protein